MALNARTDPNYVPKRINGKFAPGWSGNPGGSLEATRRSFNKDFLLALATDFKKHGAAAIEKVRKHQPAAYLKICALLVPREMKLEHSGGVKAMTDEQIERAIEWIKDMMAQREAGEMAKVIEAEAEEVSALPAPATLHSQATAPQFDLTKVTDHVYSFRSGIHRAMVVVTSDGVIVTDPINSAAAKNMMDEIKKVTDKPVKFVIYSHNHWDHVAGAKIFKDQGAKIVQHALAAQNTRPHPDVVPADETFKDDKHVVTLGDQTIELIYVGPSHGSGMIVMRVPKERVLNIVDICTPQRIGFRNFPDTSPQNTIQALRKVEALDFDQIVPGHGPASAPKAEVTAIREYLEDLTRAVSAAKEKAGNQFAFDQITELVKADLRPKYGKWGEFDNWMTMNVDRILLEQRLGY